MFKVESLASECSKQAFCLFGGIVDGVCWHGGMVYVALAFVGMM